mmetsp:Transcript_12222/g.21884  ORF Transcript_12222/g.21884 Transcript_12222/m.21884 type:complete len:209 (-) Transcript_12222:233-859(-)
MAWTPRLDSSLSIPLFLRAKYNPPLPSGARAREVGVWRISLPFGSKHGSPSCWKNRTWEDLSPKKECAAKWAMVSAWVKGLVMISQGIERSEDGDGRGAWGAEDAEGTGEEEEEEELALSITGMDSFCFFFFGSKHAPRARRFESFPREDERGICGRAGQCRSSPSGDCCPGACLGRRREEESPGRRRKSNPGLRGCGRRERCGPTQW